MTENTTYREKGRALFLAALMVLSVVAMTASFAGAAAAVNVDSDNHDDIDRVYEDAEELGEENVWTGQQIAVGVGDDANGAQIIEGFAGDDGDLVTSTNVETVNGETVVTFDAGQLNDGEVYHLYVRGEHANASAGESFWAYDMNFDAEFDDSSVAQGQNTTIDFSTDSANSSERDSYDVNITSDDFDAEDLEGIFADEGDDASDDDDVLTLESIDSDNEYVADFSDIDVGEYEFNFNVTDTVDEDDASIEVADDEEDYYFGDVDQISEGGIANITVGAEHSDSAAIVLGDKDDGYVSQAEVNFEDTDAEEVVVQFNAHAASDADDAWSAYDDENVSVENVSVYDDELGTDPLPAYNWDLSIGESFDDEYNLTQKYDGDVLVITDRAATGDVTLQTAPAADGLSTDSDYSDYEDATITETNTVANEDALILTVEDFGAEGAVETGDFEGLEIVLEEQDSGPIGDATSWNTSEGNITAEVINQDDYSGDLIYVIDYEGADNGGLESDNDYDVTFRINESNDYIDDEDDEVESELGLSLVDREVNWDAITALPADEDATATGTTTVAPGTELNAEANSPNDQGGFVEFTDVVVTEGNSPNEFAAEFDLSGEEPGVLFDLIVTDSDDVSDEVEDVELLEGGADAPATFDVGADAPSEVTVGDDASLDVTIENTGDASGTSNYSVVINGEQVDEDELELDAGESVDKSYDFDTSAEGDIDWEVATDDDDASGTLTVSPEGEEGENGGQNGTENGGQNGTSDETGEDDGSDDGTPGFGVAVALFALLAAAMLALRQQN